MLLAELVATADAVAATASRNAKIAALADLLKRLEPDEIAIAVCLLAGEPRQGRIGVGWATLARLAGPRATQPTLHIAALDDALTCVRQTTGIGSAQRRTTILVELLGKATEAEWSFVRRVLTGELRQGALQAIVADAVARAAGVPVTLVRRALMLSGDVGRTASAAMTGGLASIGLEVFRPVLPMLASTAEDVFEAIARTGLASVEWKLDGIRIQVHRRGDDVSVYTRNLNDVTERLPEVVEIARRSPVDPLVLDGEAIALDEASRPHAFQDIASRVGRHDPAAHALAMVPFFFDVLHADGDDVIDLPLTTRMATLDRAVPGFRVPAVLTDDAHRAVAVLEDALAQGHEGVVLKSATSTYDAGRRGKAWIKVKRARTFDLVVLGAEWGHGRRRGWLSNLHLGARDPRGGFVMVGKTFKGLTDELLRWQTARLLEIETARDGITVFVRPELVVEIELDGVQTSTRYPGGVALRFARVVRYRPDKLPAEADTIGALQALR